MINKKRKGSKGEREVAGIFKSWGYKARRGQQYSGANGDPDVVVENYPYPIHVEVKRTEAFEIDKFFKQANSDAREGEMPVIFHRSNRGSWVCAIEYIVFIRKFYHGAKYQFTHGMFKPLKLEDNDIHKYIGYEGFYVLMNLETFRTLERVSNNKKLFFKKAEEYENGDN